MLKRIQHVFFHNLNDCCLENYVAGRTYKYEIYL